MKIPRPTPAKSAGRTVNWGRDEEGPPEAKLDGASQALIPGRCERCDRPYPKGEWVLRFEQGVLVGVNCCLLASDTLPAGDPIPLGIGDLTYDEEIDGRDFVPRSQVMPPNKTKADMCPSCFQIPAANGLCAC